MKKHSNRYQRSSFQRSRRQESSVHFSLPFVMLLCWIQAYDGDKACICGESPDYEIDSFVDADKLLEMKDAATKTQALLLFLNQQRSGVFEVFQTLLVCRKCGLRFLTDLYGEQEAQEALSPLLLGVSNMTVMVGREVTDAANPQGEIHVSYTNATTIPEVIEAHTGYVAQRVLKRPNAD